MLVCVRGVWCVLLILLSCRFALGVCFELFFIRLFLVLVLIKDQQQPLTFDSVLCEWLKRNCDGGIYVDRDGEREGKPVNSNKKCFVVIRQIVVLSFCAFHLICI